MADTQTAPEQWRQLTPTELRFMEMPKGVRCVECKSLGGFHKATCRSTSRYEVPAAPPVAMSIPTEPVEKPTLEQEVAALRHRLTTLERRFDTLQAQTSTY